MEKNDSISSQEAWRILIEKFDIVNEVQKNGVFHIKAAEIKKIKEPRLMSKWDSSESLPQILRENKLNILPNSRNSYIIGDFQLYQNIPELNEHVIQMDRIDIPEYESIDINNISSESNAINVLIISGILDDFLGEDNTVETFNGRMGTGTFDFRVNTERNVQRRIHVENAQCEIDGGFENEESVIIMEAKNVIHPDFHIRQLYYPYRLWRSRVTKPIRLIFSVYSNMIFRLFEYRFKDLEDYSSIELVRTKNYSLQDTSISIEELCEVRKRTAIVTDDDQESSKVPFIQANSMERIISLLENMYDNPMSMPQVTELMDFEPRQSDYYFNAGKYLGLFKKKKEDGHPIVHLTSVGNRVFKMNYKERQLKLVSLILEHEVFARLFDFAIEKGDLPKQNEIQNVMKELNVCSDNVVSRRANSVLGWLKWIFNLPKLCGEYEG